MLKDAASRALQITSASLLVFCLAEVRAQGAKPDLSAREVATFFAEDVQPILESKCFRCHGAKKRIKGNLRLTTRAGILKGGDLGPAVSFDEPEESPLLRAIGYEDPNLEMPPNGKLPDGDIEILSRWVRLGIPWPGQDEDAATVVAEVEAAPHEITPGAMSFWSFRPIERPEVPQVKNSAWVRNPVDAFILRRVEDAGLQPTVAANREALARRAYYDLTGLPPPPEDVGAFVSDEHPDAYEHLVDRLLGSHHYGERWARHWLDLVRYAETNSFERDSAKPNVWRYRDYVIRSLNEDKPYDRFVREQIAGDELDQVTADSIIATGYYRLGLWDDEPSDKQQALFDELDDIVATTGRAFLGLTVDCARCHDHKIDPIPQKDYYSLVAFFRGLKPFSYKAEDVLSVISPEAEKRAYETAFEARRQRMETLEDSITELEALAASRIPEEDRTDDAKGLRWYVKANIKKLLDAEELERLEGLRNNLGEAKKTELPVVEMALSAVEREGEPPETHVLIRGNPHSPGTPVEPSFLQVLGSAAPVEPTRPAAVLTELPDVRRTSGRRRVLADWLTSPEHPLVARVMVNRIWQHHFGRGLVRSPNNYGRQGERPTHPELLDWMASEFVAGGWGMKRIHRLLMTSNTYRMSAKGHSAGLAKDPRNDLFWRMNMRRLQAEEVRDSILALSSKLNLKAGGPSIYTSVPQAILETQSRPGHGWTPSAPAEQVRRSIYIHVKRSLVEPMLATFDFADTDSSCPVRFATTQPTQALTMLNSEFMGDEARAFAARLRREAGEDREAQVRRGLQLAFSRYVDQIDVRAGLELLRSLEAEGVAPDVALDQFALMVLNLNEFIYVD